jgi:hypothetical protein
MAQILAIKTENVLGSFLKSTKVRETFLALLSKYHLVAKLLLGQKRF